ncbi:MAG: hypothetical protein GY868_02250 [Deltaproteobacteria bacterium]|nr:hypothetical protein [Deltaproteobacteria bacterium]
MIIILSLAPGQAAGNAQPEPPFKLRGWRPSGEPYRYQPDTLYQYINGAADLFIAYGFQQLSGCSYTTASGGKNIAIIDLYDMQKQLNAFAIFQTKRDPALPVLSIGAGATAAESYCIFFKAKWYVEIQTSGGTIGQQETAALARRIAAQLPGSDSMPAELRLLPPEGLHADSIRYLRGGILGYDFMPAGLTARYGSDQETCSAYIAFFSNPAVSKKALQQHRLALQNTAAGLPANFQTEGFQALEPYHKQLLAARSGRFIAGVYDVTNIKNGSLLLKQLLKNLTRTTPADP